jgi:hypothetical protein
MNGTLSRTIFYNNAEGKVLPVEGDLYTGTGWVLNDNWTLSKVNVSKKNYLEEYSIPHVQSGVMNKIATLNGTVYLTNNGGAGFTFDPVTTLFNSDNTWSEVGVAAIIGVFSDIYLFLAPVPDEPLPTYIDKVITSQLAIKYQGQFYKPVVLKDLNLSGTTVVEKLISNGPTSINGALTLSGWKIEVV